MNKDFRDQCSFLEENTGLDIRLCVGLMSAAHKDRLALHDSIKALGRFSEGRRRWLFKLVSATKHGFNIFAGRVLT
jgi:hypothetical protein